MKLCKTLLSASVFSILTACGGGSSDTPSTSSSPAATAETGVFLDSPVINIGYRTETLEGVTNSLGEYKYLAGETVTFFIGDLVFPATAAIGTVTPLDLADSVDISDPKVINMIRLLQTLDADANPDNGLTITDMAKSAATQVDFSLSEAEFEIHRAVTELISNGGQDTIPSGLVATNAAVAHFEEVLVANKIIEDSKLKLVDFSSLIAEGGTATFEFMLHENGGVTPVTVFLDSNDTGNMSFSADEVNSITSWSISSSGVLQIEEVADDNSIGNWKFTPIASEAGFAVRVEQTPVDLDFVGEVEIGFSSLMAGTYESQVAGDSAPTNFVLNQDNTGNWSYKAESGTITWSLKTNGVLTITYNDGTLEEYTLTSGDSSSGTVSVNFSDEPDKNATWLKI